MTHRSIYIIIDWFKYIYGSLRVVEPGVVQIVADRGREEDAEVGEGELGLEIAQVDHAVHHLRHAEAVPEVVERVVAIILLDAQLDR